MSASRLLDIRFMHPQNSSCAQQPGLSDRNRRAKLSPHDLQKRRLRFDITTSAHAKAVTLPECASNDSFQGWSGPTRETRSNYRFGQRQSLVSPKWTTATSLNQPSVAAHQTKAHGRDCNFTSTSGRKRLGRRWQSPRRWRGSHARLQLRSVLRHASCGWVQVQAERTRATSSCGCGL